MIRFPEIAENDRSEDQRKVVAEIASGPRGGVRGPFVALLHAPELARRVAHLGEYLRFNNSLDNAIAEFAVLITARQCTAQFEFFAHARHARNAGVDPAIIEAIARREPPPGLSPAQGAVYDFCMELHRRHAVSDANFQRIVDLYGHRGAADLIALTGYYTMVAMVLNVAEVPVPPGEKPPLD
ncbi:MAG TPA: carboxymuconolactone decarboxylase family protein [Pseudolabrys sp.]|nr:carboxymuconolactone decarboxylase family protein [Pseudolabrys sp.]